MLSKRNTENSPFIQGITTRWGADNYKNKYIFEKSYTNLSRKRFGHSKNRLDNRFRMRNNSTMHQLVCTLRHHAYYYTNML